MQYDSWIFLYFCTAVMEVKKSRKADLERGWLQRFLLGLVLAGACLFVGLEFSIEPDDPLDDPELLEMLAGDEELSPLLQPENELALAPKAEPQPSQRLKVVDEDTEKEPQETEQVETDADTDMEAMEEEETLPPPPDDDDVVSFRVVEDMPQFPGGPTEFIKWLTRNLKYPEAARQRNVQGKVVAEFIVNKDGSVTNVAIVTSLSPPCDREVLRVLRMMPRWQAGIQNNEPCRTKVCIPVVFRQ